MAGEISNQDNQQLTVSDIEDILNDDSTPESKEEVKDDLLKIEEEPEEEEEEPVVDDKVDDKTEEEKEEPEEKIEVKDEDDELTFHAIPKRAEILKQFPDLYKKFPGIEKAIYRDHQYSEVFPTPSAAKEAHEAIQNYRQLESDLMQGNIVPTLVALKRADNGSFDKISDNILEVLHKVDPQSYSNVLERVLRTALHRAHQRGKSDKNENLELAAEILNNYIFEEKEVKPYTKVAQTKDDPRETELRDKQIQFARQQLDNAVNDVSTRAQNVVKASIDKYLDPKGVMSNYVKTKAADDILTEVNQAIQSDRRFQEVLDRLWRASGSESYSESSRLKIRNALLTKAQAVLPEIMKKVKSEALKGITTRVRAKTKEEVSRSKLPERETKVPDKKMSTFDFLNQD